MIHRSGASCNSADNPFMHISIQITHTHKRAHTRALITNICNVHMHPGRVAGAANSRLEENGSAIADEWTKKAFPGLIDDCSTG